MITHLLDTSAWLAHALQEPGSEFVSSLLLDTEYRVAVSVLSLIEFHARMRQLRADWRFDEVVGKYKSLFAAVLQVDELIVLRAIDLRLAANSRVPMIDAIIAATAAHHNAILVHRDGHFAALAAADLRQQLLS